MLVCQNPFNLWIGFDQPGFGAGRQVELTDPGGVGFLQVLLPCAWLRGSGTTRERPGAANHTPSSRRLTYSPKASLSMQYVGAGQRKDRRGRQICLACVFGLADQWASVPDPVVKSRIHR